MTAMNLEMTLLHLRQEAELTEGEFEMEDELEDMEDLAEAANGAGPSSDEDDEEEDKDTAPAMHGQRGRQRPGPKQGALHACCCSLAALVLVRCLLVSHRQCAAIQAVI